MPTQYLSIKNVTPQTKRHWAVNVQVLEKCPPHTSANGSKTYQRLILLDKEVIKKSFRTMYTVAQIDVHIEC